MRKSNGAVGSTGKCKRILARLVKQDAGQPVDKMREATRAGLAEPWLVRLSYSYSYSSYYGRTRAKNSDRHAAWIEYRVLVRKHM